MRSACSGLALSMLAASGAVGETRPPPDPGAVFWCVAESLRVDGLPVLRHAWCAMTADGRMVMLGTDEGDQQVFNLRPAREPRPPIPKHQRRME